MILVMVDLRPARPITSPIGGTTRRLQASHFGPRLELRFRWRRPEHLIALSVLVVCVVALSIALFQLPRWAWLFDLIGFAAFTSLAYIPLVGVVNITTLTISPERIQARHSPLPGRAGVDLSIAEILQ